MRAKTNFEGIAAAIGSVGDAYDNALAETTIGLFKTECVGRGSPFLTGPLRTLEDVEYATMEWIDWSTIGVCTANSTTSHPRNTRPPTTRHLRAVQPVTLQPGSHTSNP